MVVGLKDLEMSKKVNHLLTNGGLYYVEGNFIIIKDKKYVIELENNNLGLDETGDTVQAVIVNDELFIENLGRSTKIKIKKKGSNG